MLKRTLISTALLAVLAQTVAAQMCVLGSNQLPIQSLSQSQVTDLFQGKNVENLTPVDMPSGSKAYADFYNVVLNMSPEEVNSYWSGQVFGGGAQQPQQADSAMQVVEYVRDNPGVIGYMNLGANERAPAGTQTLYCADEQNSDVYAQTQPAVTVAAKQVQQAAAKPVQAKVSAQPQVASTATPTTDASTSALHDLVAGKGVAQIPASVKQSNAQAKAAIAKQQAAASPSALAKIAADIDKLNISKTINHTAKTTALSAASIHLASRSTSRSALISKMDSHTVWPQIVKNYQMDDSIYNPKVRGEVNWFLQHPGDLQTLLKNSEPYIYYVFSETQKRKLPSELALLPFIESNYDPYSYSHAGAKGLWQLEPVTAAQYGSTTNWWYDGLSDVRSSTNSALAYLEHLHSDTNSWELALAAYNAGYGTVHRAMNEENSRNYWNLNTLPLETKYYVPKLLAVAYLIEHADQYGIKLPAVANKPYFTVVPMKKQIELEKAAEFAGVSVAELKRLNPGFRRFATTPNTSYDLLIPTANVQQFQENLSKVAGHEQHTWLYHEATSGESLDTIARAYHTTVALLRSVNGLTADTLSLDQGVLVPEVLHSSYTPALTPVTPADAKLFAEQLPVAKKMAVTVAKGDTLLSLATKYNVTPAQIRVWNHLGMSAQLQPGQHLAVWLIGSDNAPQIGHLAESDTQQLDGVMKQIYS